MASIFEKTMAACMQEATASKRVAEKKNLKNGKKLSEKKLTRKVEADELDELGDEFNDVADDFAEVEDDFAETEGDLADLEADEDEFADDIETEMEINPDFEDDVATVVDTEIDDEDSFLKDALAYFQDEAEEGKEIAEDAIDDADGDEATTDNYVGQNVYICPICGSTFFNEGELEDGDMCPVCGETPEAFVYCGTVESTEEGEEDKEEDTEAETEDVDEEETEEDKEEEETDEADEEDFTDEDFEEAEEDEDEEDKAKEEAYRRRAAMRRKAEARRRAARKSPKNESFILHYGAFAKLCRDRGICDSKEVARLHREYTESGVTNPEVFLDDYCADTGRCGGRCESKRRATRKSPKNESFALHYGAFAKSCEDRGIYDDDEIARLFREYTDSGVINPEVFLDDYCADTGFCEYESKSRTNEGIFNKKKKAKKNTNNEPTDKKLDFLKYADEDTKYFYKFFPEYLKTDDPEASAQWDLYHQVGKSNWADCNSQEQNDFEDWYNVHFKTGKKTRKQQAAQDVWDQLYREREFDKKHGIKPKPNYKYGGKPEYTIGESVRRPARREYMLDEKTFERHLCRFFAENYSNVTDVNIKSAVMKENKLGISATLTFKSGRTKKVPLVIENFNMKSGAYMVRDLKNAFESKSSKNPFKFKITVENNVVRCEGMAYKFETVHEGKRVLVSGLTTKRLSESKKKTVNKTEAKKKDDEKETKGKKEPKEKKEKAAVTKTLDDDQIKKICAIVDYWTYDKEEDGGEDLSGVDDKNIRYTKKNKADAAKMGKLCPRGDINGGMSEETICAFLKAERPDLFNAIADCEDKKERQKIFKQIRTAAEDGDFKKKF